MSDYFFNNKFNLGFINIAKNSSLSMTPYLKNSGFQKIFPKDIPSNIEELLFFYILRNPIDRFCSGITETYCKGWGLRKTEQALLAMSDSSQQEFCFNLLMRLVPWAENNIPVKEGNGYQYDVHTELQTGVIRNIQNCSNAIIVPISIKLTSEIPQILFHQTNMSGKQSLLHTPVKHLNQSIDDEKRLNVNMKEILVTNRQNACMKNIWHYLQPDIDHWNTSIEYKYMEQQHSSETI